MKSTLTSKLAMAFTACVIAAVSSSALADTRWEQHHPRRDQVNDRLERQHQRIHHEVREGDLSRAQAARLHHEDRGIRHEERVMASQHHGHITLADKRALNRQENAVSHQIGR